MTSEKLVAYAVLKQVEPETAEPYCIVKLTLDLCPPTSEGREIIDRHADIRLARYWATMLNEGRESEESVRHKMAEARAA